MVGSFLYLLRGLAFIHVELFQEKEQLLLVPSQDLEDRLRLVGISDKDLPGTPCAKGKARLADATLHSLFTSLHGDAHTSVYIWA